MDFILLIFIDFPILEKKPEFELSLLILSSLLLSCGDLNGEALSSDADVKVPNSVDLAVVALPVAVAVAELA